VGAIVLMVGVAVGAVEQNDHRAKRIVTEHAERRAFLDFGNVAGLEEAIRDVRGRRLADVA